jgi:hypothetical protein
MSLRKKYEASLRLQKELELKQQSTTSLSLDTKKPPGKLEQTDIAVSSKEDADLARALQESLKTAESEKYYPDEKSTSSKLSKSIIRGTSKEITDYNDKVREYLLYYADIDDKLGYFNLLGKTISYNDGTSATSASVTSANKKNYIYKCMFCSSFMACKPKSYEREKISISIFIIYSTLKF